MDTTTPATEGFISFRDYKVWYRIVGDGEAPGKLPLLCLRSMSCSSTARICHMSRNQSDSCRFSASS